MCGCKLVAMLEGRNKGNNLVGIYLGCELVGGIETGEQ